MSLGVDNVIQENTGTTVSGTSHVVSLPSGTVAGNTVLVVMRTVGVVSGLPTGFVTVKTNFDLRAMVKSEVAASETSWTFTTSGAAQANWYVAEMSNVDAVEPLDASATGQGSVGNGGTLSTGTTGLDAGLSTVAFAVFGGQHLAATSWAGYTNGFEEVADISGSATVGDLAVARLFENNTTRTFESTATLTTGASAATTYSMMVVFRAADSPIVAPLNTFCGFDWATIGGAAASGSTSMFGGLLAPGGTWGTNYLIQAASARNSAYGLQIVKAAVTAYVMIGNIASKSATFGTNVRVVSATGTVVVAELSSGAQLLYDSAATKYGLRCSSTGTTSWASTTTALNTWVWVDVRAKTSTSTWHAEWRLETAPGVYTDQPAADETGKSILNIQTLYLGGSGSQTVTVDFDDVLFSTYYVAYPLGAHECRLLTVDPAGTPTISGTTTNFSTFASNGTLTAWNATTARNNIDEVPVTVSASADGVVQTTTAASDYMEFPMQTYTLGSTEYIDGVRMLAPLWSGTGAGAGDLAIRGWDGTTETALATASQITPGSPTAVSSTAPVWRCGMWQSTNGWSQAELDAAALRIGFSGDATPDMGVSAAYLEVAIGKTKTSPLFGTSVSAEVDPTRLGVVSVTTTAPDSGAVSLYYEQGGSPTTVPVTAGSTVVSQVNSEMAPDTNYVAAYWPPEGVPDA